MLSFKEIEIGGRVVRVNEVRARQVLALLPGFSVGRSAGGEDEAAPADEQPWSDKLEALLLECCGLRVEDLVELRGSELELLWKTIKAVNPFFFRLASSLDLEKAVGGLVHTLLAACGETFAGLLSAGTAEPPTTASAGSSAPSSTPSG
jgi:hypothetical protein